MSEDIPGLQFENIDFEPEKETWNVYELGDRSIIRIRTVLVKLLRSIKSIPQKTAAGQEMKTLEFQAKFQNLLAVTKVTPTLMGKPTPPLPPNELLKMEKVEVNYTPFQEDWNVYKLPDGTKIKVKLVISAVFRVKGQFDELGYPMYAISSTNAVSQVPKV